MAISKRRVHLFPLHIIDPVEEEANRRIVESSRVGEDKTGSVARDILCLCVEKALNDIKRMSKLEFENAIKKCKRNKQ